MPETQNNSLHKALLKEHRFYNVFIALDFFRPVAMTAVEAFLREPEVHEQIPVKKRWLPSLFTTIPRPLVCRIIITTTFLRQSTISLIRCEHSLVSIAL